MAEQDEVGRALALARQSLRGPEAMKDRLRARLVVPPTSAPPPSMRSASRAGASGAAEGASTAGAREALLRAGRRLLAHRYHLGTLVTLVGVGFGAGLWLGQQPNAGVDGDIARGLRPNRADGFDARFEANAVGSSVPAPGARITAGAIDASNDGAASGAVAVREPAPGATRLSPPLHDPSSAHPEAIASAHTPPARSSAHGSTRSESAGERRATRSPAAELSSQGGTPRVALPAARGSADDDLVREVALLERIERAIRAGEGALARALLAELDSAVPAPALGDERAAARVLAQCIDAPRRGSLRDADDSANESLRARRAGERFLAQSPGSVYADRVRAACAIDAVSSNRPGGVEEHQGGGHRAE